ncbi:Uma2 family endonuclease [Paludisphaera mucosa]|uniref:Uma2 family endonuclease n=1 Tax=Paludisphaera mucosa TaxID=3030827 RepID=A0ABT6FE46_9BACT|nr:Uma2 family endonuclease [Paludisphaera mucosa]MDG3005819.1 Uma2 family endonuclease [Paludisphaera mucosa]
MATAPAARLMTAEEFMRADLGEGPHELVRGEVVLVTPPPGYGHGSICYNLSGLFWEYQRRTGYGHAATNDSAVQTQRSPDTVRGADFVFFSNARWPKPTTFVTIPPIAPDLAVEVVSPSNRRGEILEKVAEYLNAGTLVVWIVYPKKRSIAIYRDAESPPVVLNDGDVLENFPELRGFRCLVSDVFA